MILIAWVWQELGSERLAAVPLQVPKQGVYISLALPEVPIDPLYGRHLHSRQCTVADMILMQTLRQRQKT